MNVRRSMMAFVAMLGGCLAIAGSMPARAFDPLLAERSVSTTPAADMLNGRICKFGELPNPLRLQDVVERAMCSHAKTRLAWANVKIQAAAVGQARAAFLPTLNGSWQGTHDVTNNRVKGYPRFDSSYRTNLQSANVSLSWVLYDFGGRSAGLRGAAELLAAAQANQLATLQTVFATVARDFYAAQAAQGALTSAREVEQTAHSSAKAAAARVNKGVAAISDQLQAQTAYAEAVMNRTRAEIEWQAAQGTLASDMSLAPTTAIKLPDVSDGVMPDTAFAESVDALIDVALRNAPGVKAASSKVRAAHAKAAQVRAEGLPRVSLVGQYNFNNQPTSLQSGFPPLPATHREWYVGLQLTIPIFEGFSRSYQVKQAHAQAELELDSLDEVRQQVSLDVWRGYHSVKGATDALGHSATLLALSQRSHDVAMRRYQAGVGSILELLNSQSALAGAKRQRIQALTDWRTARLQLAATLGRLGMWSLDGEHP
ncbi:protein CyaE [Trinickia caryophylli]|uniref:Protein CyaE n=2 Tax=Trinickia caryophylli TaxID=28094 RepID=A0A1X7CZM6_TRICW|nr:protein CyaE [Trinickia caryophylli]SMF05977.1 outer membrane protein [Trinickia caryophylli]